jgi:hypothetical protein
MKVINEQPTVRLVDVNNQLQATNIHYYKVLVPLISFIVPTTYESTHWTKLTTVISDLTKQVFFSQL